MHLMYLIFLWIISLRTVLIGKYVYVHSKCVWAYLWVYMTYTSQLYGAHHLFGSYYFTIFCYISSFYFALPVVMLNIGGTTSRQSIEQLPGEKTEMKWLNNWGLTLKRIVLQLTIAVYLRNKISDKYIITKTKIAIWYCKFIARAPKIIEKQCQNFSIDLNFLMGYSQHE